MHTTPTALARTACWLALVAAGGQAATIRVPEEQPTIQAGIDAAAEGDTILVARGTYTGAGNFNIDFSPPPSDEPKNLVVIGEAGPELTIIDVQGSSQDPRRGFIFDSSEGPESLVEGFTIRNGFMSTAPDRPYARHEVSGGGMVFRDIGTAPVVRNCIFESNFSQISGGGIEAEIRAAPLIESCVFVGNTSLQGGAISLESTSLATIRDCVITGNGAIECGGGISFTASALVEGCVIAGNRAKEGGGVVSAYPALPTLRNVIVWGNCAQTIGDNAWAQVSGSLAFECSAVDTSGPEPPGTVTYDAESIFVDPLFCDARSCQDVPELGGDYRLDASSPALAGATGCGLMGPLGVGCDVQPVDATTWGALKSRYGRERR